MRKSVLRFAEHMEVVLQRNADKGGWQDCDPEWLFDRLIREAKELRAEIMEHAGDCSYPNAGAIQNEAADVANFAMMIFDRVKP